MNDPITTALIIVTILVVGVLGFSIGWDRGRNRGRIEVLNDWWNAKEAEYEKGRPPLDATLDEIMRRNPDEGRNP